MRQSRQAPGITIHYRPDNATLAAGLQRDGPAIRDRVALLLGPEAGVPVQVILLPITDSQNPYAEQVASRLEEEGIRVEKDLRNEKIGFKIRQAQLQKIPYMLVLGDQEIEAKTVAVRKRKSKETRVMPVEDFLKELNELIETKAVDDE